MVFEPIRTERLIIRWPELSDADAAFERRNLPEVARYQDWTLPYTREQADAAMEHAAALEGLVDGQGLNLAVVDAAQPGRILGDLYVEIKWGGRSSMIGYTFHPDHWGRGYASEAAQALVRHLFTEVGVLRVEASLHPDNVASARVLEACGMRFEGRTRQSFWVGDECSDDMLYGVTRQDWDAWCARSRLRPGVVELIPVTSENVRLVAALETHKSQERFVTPMAGSFRDALVPDQHDGATVVPWFRAIEADGEIVGFVMAAEQTAAHPNPYLWRLLIDRVHQRRGVGTMALDRFEQRCRDVGATAIEVSWVEGAGSPSPMYRARGYQPTGKIEDGETHALKRLT